MFSEQWDLEAATDELGQTSERFNTKFEEVGQSGLCIEILKAVLPKYRAVRSALEAREVVECVTLRADCNVRKWVEQWLDEVEAMTPSLHVFMDRDDYARTEIDSDDLLDSLSIVHTTLMSTWSQLDFSDFEPELSSEPGLYPELGQRFYGGLKAFELALHEHDLWYGIMKRRESAVPIEGSDDEEGWGRSTPDFS